MHTYFGLPAEVQFCKSCVVSNQRPSSTVEYENTNKKRTIEFDEEGTCSACRLHKQKYESIDWTRREEKLLRLLDKHRSKRGDFDVIVPGSGGKDSIFVANELKEKYGMTPLTVTWPPHIYTDIGFKNFVAWLDMGFSNLTISPNRRLHREMTREAFVNLCHPFQPFILGQKTIGPRVALDYGVPLVMYGESQAEGGSDLDEAADAAMPAKYYSSPEGQKINAILGGVEYKEWIERGYGVGDLSPYLPVSAEKGQRLGLEVHHYGYYHLWRPQDCYYYAVENSGFKANPERTEGTFSKYASLDDKIDGFHYYTTYIKFGIGRATYEAAQEIRNDHITRKEGVALVRKYDGEFPSRYFEDFLEYCELTEEQFRDVIDKNRSPHLWDNTNSGWELRFRIS